MVRQRRGERPALTACGCPGWSFWGWSCSAAALGPHGCSGLGGSRVRGCRKPARGNRDHGRGRTAATATGVWMEANLGKDKSIGFIFFTFSHLHLWTLEMRLLSEYGHVLRTQAWTHGHTHTFPCPALPLVDGRQS